MRDDLHEFARWLRGQRAERRWSRRRLAYELRQRARAHGEQLPSDESIIKTIARWEKAEHRPDDFYAGLLLEVFGKAALANLAGPSILEPVERRAFLRGLGAFTGLGVGSAILEPWERLSTALRRPGRVDAETVDSLEHVTVLLEQMESQASPAALLGPVVGHLENIGRLIAGSPPDKLDRRLCSLAGETAALAGWLSWDLKNGRGAAAAYFRAGLEAATEAGDRALGAYLVGSSCVEPAYRERPIARLRRLEGQTFGFARSYATPETRSWLVTLAAEAHALAGDYAQTLRTFDEAEAAMNHAGEQAEIRRPRVVFFDAPRLAGERGVALARLGQPEPAQEALRPALASLDPSVVKTRPRLLTALATAHVQQGDVDEASRLGIEALTLAAQQQVQPNLQDVLRVRLELEPWRKAQAVREFDERLHLAGAA
jgi:tetratricopeptide (TPR) repeat protein